MSGNGGHGAWWILVLSSALISTAWLLSEIPDPVVQ